MNKEIQDLKDKISSLEEELAIKEIEQNPYIEIEGDLWDYFRCYLINGWGIGWSKHNKENPDQLYPNGFNLIDVWSNGEDEFNYQMKDNYEYMQNRYKTFVNDLEKEFQIS